MRIGRFEIPLRGARRKPLPRGRTGAAVVAKSPALSLSKTKHEGRHSHCLQDGKGARFDVWRARRGFKGTARDVWLGGDVRGALTLRLLVVFRFR